MVFYFHIVITYMQTIQMVLISHHREEVVVTKDLQHVRLQYRCLAAGLIYALEY